MHHRIAVEAGASRAAGQRVARARIHSPVTSASGSLALLAKLNWVIPAIPKVGVTVMLVIVGLRFV